MRAWLWTAFALHLTAALMLTGGIHLRCEADAWLSLLRVDARTPPEGSAALWVDVDPAWLAACPPGGANATCARMDLPLYERTAVHAGFHLFGLLTHFEWVSAAFALYYLQAGWGTGGLFWLPILLAAAGTAASCAPRHGTWVAGEVALYVANLAAVVVVFAVYRALTRPEAEPGGPDPRVDFHSRMEGAATRDVHLGAMRYWEYCVTAPELFLAVLSVFVRDPPAFMAIGGYAMIVLCNLYGVMLHYALVGLPEGYAPLAAGARGLVVPPAWLGVEAEPGFAELIETVSWGSYIASNTSTLFNSWLVFVMAMGLILYQQTFLTSGDPPVYVVFSGWSLLVSYASFGVWATAVYLFPERLVGWLARPCGTRGPWQLLNRGLDVLSVSAKLSIVGALAAGFVFMAEGGC